MARSGVGFCQITLELQAVDTICLGKRKWGCVQRKVADIPLNMYIKV